VSARFEHRGDGERESGAACAAGQRSKVETQIACRKSFATIWLRDTQMEMWHLLNGGLSGAAPWPLWFQRHDAPAYKAPLRSHVRNWQGLSGASRHWTVRRVLRADV
jgi:hypothetical protein